jgi:hypothetical protein
MQKNSELSGSYPFIPTLQQKAPTIHNLSSSHFLSLPNTVSYHPATVQILNPTNNFLKLM